MRKKSLLILVTLIVTAGLVFYFLTAPLFAIPSPHSLDFDNEKFTSLAQDILQQNQIFEMDDCSRHVKRLNGTGIRMTEAFTGLDSLCCPEKYCCPVYYKKALDSLQVDFSLFEKLKTDLTKTELYSFYKSQDSVLFIVDGFLDDSWGFFYNPRGLTNDTTYFSFGTYSVKFVDSINKNWTRAAIN